MNQKSSTNGSGAISMEDYLSDKDEWDILDDETLKKTIKDQDFIVKNFQVGDRVEAISGQCRGSKGQITEIFNDSLGKSFTFIKFILTRIHIVMMKTLDSNPIEIKIFTKDLQKFFKTGEMVRIISGVHSGGSGSITAILDKHAIVAMEGTMHEMKILMSNLQIKRDEMDHVRMD
jgi:transcription antitermination factor NusG